MIQSRKEQTETLPMSNADLADRLAEIADRLDAEDANPFRVRSYRTAAETVRHLQKPVYQVIDEEGTEGLTELPGIGESLARSIERLARTGRLSLLTRLRGDVAVERLLATVPGIGPEMATRIHETIGIETLADLEAAAYDGRLAQVAGMGYKRIRAVRESLAGRFRRRPAEPESKRMEPASPPPPVAELLDIDEEYCRKAEADRLPRIAPRRFNPTGEAWLPILHTRRDDRHYTALYSNTARAHDLGTFRDWVVIYRDDGDDGGQWTVVTSRIGKLAGRRIVRGREAECMAHYADLPEPAALAQG